MTLEKINYQLKRDYGNLQGTEEPHWRVSWSEDQFETRFGTFEDRTPEGILIRRVTEARIVPKYRQWNQNRYILEKLFPNNGTELVCNLTYEPVYTFENPYNGPPSYEAVKFVVELIYKQAAEAIGVKYKEPDAEEEEEIRKARIKRIMEELYGDRSEVTDALAYKEGIVVPKNYGVVN